MCACSASASSLSIERVRTFDVSNIPGLAFHPACVILVALTNLRTETALRSSGGGNRDSLSQDFTTHEAGDGILSGNVPMPSGTQQVIGAKGHSDIKRTIQELPY